MYSMVPKNRSRVDYHSRVGDKLIKYDSPRLTAHSKISRVWRVSCSRREPNPITTAAGNKTIRVSSYPGISTERTQHAVNDATHVSLEKVLA